MQASGPQGLVRVDVADTSHERLVQQEWLQAAASRSQPLPKQAEREGVVKGLRARAREDRRAAQFFDGLSGLAVDGIQPDLAELPDVPEPEVAPVAERHHEADVRIERRGPRDDKQLAGHLEVDRHHSVPGQADDKLLAAPPDRLDPAAGQCRADLLRGVRAQRPGPQARGTGNLGIEDEAAEVTSDRLHLGKFGHVRFPAPRRLRRGPHPCARRAASTPSRRRPSHPRSAARRGAGRSP